MTATVERMDYRDVYTVLTGELGCGPTMSEGDAADLCRTFGVVYLAGNQRDKVVATVSIADYLAARL